MDLIYNCKGRRCSWHRTCTHHSRPPQPSSRHIPRTMLSPLQIRAPQSHSLSSPQNSCQDTFCTCKFVVKTKLGLNRRQLFPRNQTDPKNHHTLRIRCRNRNWIHSHSFLRSKTFSDSLDKMSESRMINASDLAGIPDLNYGRVPFINKLSADGPSTCQILRHTCIVSKRLAPRPCLSQKPFVYPSHKGVGVCGCDSCFLECTKSFAPPPSDSFPVHQILNRRL